MDPAQLAAAAVALVAPYLTQAGQAAATKAGDAVGQQIGAVLQAIRRRFLSDGDTYAQQTLDRLEQKPDAEGRQRALSEVLAEKAADPEFAQELTRLLQAAHANPATSQFVTQVSGNARVGQIFNAGSVDTINVGDHDPA